MTHVQDDQVAEDRPRTPEELVRLAGVAPLVAVEQIMALLRSPAGCPWDREQTFESIRRYTLEEVYEVFDAIERRAWPELQDELGDLLLQVLFYAQMAAEEGRFTLTDVAGSLSAKLIRRHPHIFADATVRDSAEVKRNWDEIKRGERQRRGETMSESRLAGVPRGTPALAEARALGSAAAKAGFDWEDVSGVLAKVREELLELEAELVDAGVARRPAAIADELGDVLFSVANVARHLGVDAEMALRDANAKFRRRFMTMETIAREAARGLEERSTVELEALWQEAKRHGRSEEPQESGST